MPSFIKPRYLTVAIIIMTLFLATPVIYAQTGNLLKLEQAIELALHNDTGVAVAGNDLAKAKLAVDLEKINRLPSASTTGQYNDYLKDSNNRQNYQVKIEQTIPTGFHLYGADVASDVETKRWEQQKSLETYRIKRAEAVNNTINLYFSALKAQKAWEYQQMAVEYAKANVTFQKQQLKLGKVTKTTQLTAENDLAKANYELTKSHQAYLLSLKKLAGQLGITSYQSLVLDDTLLQQTLDIIDYEKQKQQAINERPEIKQFQLELKTAQQELATAKNSGLPSLNLNYQDRSELKSYDAQYDLLSGNLKWSAAWQKTNTGDSKLENFNEEDLFGSDRRKIGVILKWTLDCGSAANRIKQAQYSVESARRNLEQSYQDIALQIDEAVSNYESALAALNCSREGISLYEKTLELKQLQAKLGAATALDVKKAQLDLINAQKEVASANCDLYIAAAQLKLELGLLYDI
ncbi:MAG TPA: TolC family protein [Bacillota bacterium]